MHEIPRNKPEIRPLNNIKTSKPRKKTRLETLCLYDKNLDYRKSFNERRCLKPY